MNNEIKISDCGAATLMRIGALILQRIKHNSYSCHREPGVQIIEGDLAFTEKVPARSMCLSLSRIFSDLCFY